MDKLQTVIHAYRFDIRQPEEKDAYEALCSHLKEQGLKCFETHGGGSHYKPELNNRTIELETKHLFNNQWNTAPIEGISESGLRVFDWAQDYESNIGAPRGIKRGHYLEQTPEMREIRRNTNVCGYCGYQEAAARGSVFCPKCIDSEYLKESDLNLTRMIAVECSGPGVERAPLTTAEREHLLPKYREAQIHGSTERGKNRIANERAKIMKDAEKAIENATTKRDGLLWLMDRGIRTDNVIFYDHTGVFSFGWRSPVSNEMRDLLLEHISEFPFPYEIKCADGKKLEGY